jgi:magnesium transporter
LITAHTEENIPLKAILGQFKEDEMTKTKAMSKTSGFLLYSILEMLLSSCFPKIDHISERLNEIEKEIFDDNEKEMVKETSIVKRDILAFRRTLKPQRAILESLAQKHYTLLEKELDKYFQDLIGTNIRVWNALENTKEVIESLEETNNSLVSHKINQTMRLFTAISFITFTLSVFVGIFGMTPFESFSASQNKNTFWIVILFMGLIAFGLLLIFRRKKWI